MGPKTRWEEVAHGKEISEDLAWNDGAAEIWAAIARKLTHAWRGGILAVSVGQPGMHAFRQTVQAFRRTYSPRVREHVQYSEVWLVGYSAETTALIHPTYWPDSFGL